MFKKHTNLITALFWLGEEPATFNFKTDRSWIRRGRIANIVLNHATLPLDKGSFLEKNYLPFGYFDLKPTNNVTILLYSLYMLVDNGRKTTRFFCESVLWVKYTEKQRSLKTYYSILCSIFYLVSRYKREGVFVTVQYIVLV